MCVVGRLTLIIQYIPAYMSSSDYYNLNERQAKRLRYVPTYLQLHQYLHDGFEQMLDLRGAKRSLPQTIYTTTRIVTLCLKQVWWVHVYS